MSVPPITIPIHAVGAGSHKEEIEAETIGVPDSVSTFKMPSAPHSASIGEALACRTFFHSLYEAMRLWNKDSGDSGPALALNEFSASSLRLINEMLGEGEVSIRVKIPQEKFDEIRIQESVFVGVWRVRYFRGGTAIADQVEVSPLPLCVAESAYLSTAPELLDVHLPQDAMNSPALLSQLRQSLEDWKPGSAAVTINLSHLPLTPSDLQVINDAVGEGNVHMVSRGLGNCHIFSTSVRHVWKVQYFNNPPMNRMILNTLSICGVPEEAIASTEDLEDSVARIRELIEWVTESWHLPALNLE
jgi:hydrogenase-1 operon protein HyaF